MSDFTSDLAALSPAQQDALLELGSRGSSSQLDPDAMCELFTLGIVAVSNLDRRVLLTDRGRRAYAELSTSTAACLAK